MRESSLIMGIDSTGCGIGEGAAGMDFCAAPQRQKKMKILEDVFEAMEGEKGKP